MLSYYGSSKHNTKKVMQSTVIFQYYMSSLFPRIFSKKQYPSSQPQRYSVTQRNIHFHYAHDITAGFNQITSEIALRAVKQIYFPKYQHKARESWFVNQTNIKLPYLPIHADFIQNVCIFLSYQGLNKETEPKRSLFLSPQKDSKEIQRGTFRVLGNQNLKTKQSKNNNIPQQFYLYIVHYKDNTKKQDQNNRWQNFIQRYNFTYKLQNDQYKPLIIYDVAFSVQSSSIFSINQTQRFLQLFYQTSVFDKNNSNKSKFLQSVRQRILFIIQEGKRKQAARQKQISLDDSHRRYLKLNSQQKIIFQRLKIKTFAIFSTLNRSRTINNYFLQNLICRMMQNNDFLQKQSLQSLQYYLKFQSNMRNKYRWQDFQIYNKMNIFSYIGKDYMGRPILLNRMRKVLCSKIQDFQLFYDYHMYLFQIYMQDQMEGYVDQFVVISDASNQISDNTNLGFTKKIIMQGLKLFKRRHYKMISFDIGMIGTLLFNLVKNLLPKQFIDVVKIIGSDRQQLLKELTSFIPLDVIPEFIGGRNPTIDSQSLGKDSSQHRLTEVTSQKSLGIRGNRRR